MRAWLKSLCRCRGLYPICVTLRHVVRVLVCRWRYERTLRRLRSKVARGEKLKVMFLSGNVSKWKTQSLYEEMAKSEMFDPVVALTFPTDFPGNASELSMRIEADEAFFRRQGDRTVRACDIERREGLSPSEFGADIVFLQEPWSLFKCQSPLRISQYALTCYVPYYVPNYSSLELEVMREFHGYLQSYFVMNQMAADEYRNVSSWWNFTCRYVAAGHPALDCFATIKHGYSAEDYVIYAPHWSIPHPKNLNDVNYSTFMDTGRFMLDYAQKHPQFKWVFKPHPTLKAAIIRTGEWSCEEVESYYGAWERLGIACYTADYPALFMQAQLMVTDCGSFLSEFSATGKPLIRLVSTKAKLESKGYNAELFDSFYNVKGVDELQAVLDQLLVQRDDPRMEERMAAVRKAGLLESHAGEAIVDWLADLCSGVLRFGRERYV